MPTCLSEVGKVAIRHQQTFEGYDMMGTIEILHLSNSKHSIVLPNIGSVVLYSPVVAHEIRTPMVTRSSPP